MLTLASLPPVALRCGLLNGSTVLCVGVSTCAVGCVCVLMLWVAEGAARTTTDSSTTAQTLKRLLDRHAVPLEVKAGSLVVLHGALVHLRSAKKARSNTRMSSPFPVVPAATTTLRRSRDTPTPCTASKPTLTTRNRIGMTFTSAVPASHTAPAAGSSAPMALPTSSKSDRTLQQRLLRSVTRVTETPP